MFFCGGFLTTKGFILPAEKSLKTLIIAFWSAVYPRWKLLPNIRIGKLPEAQPIIEQYAALLTQSRFQELPITTAHALRAGSLPTEHRDPFDRVLMAQAELEKIPIITYYPAFQTGLIEILPKPEQKF
jgi:PIN domain nuclease of toxin-antitoxin system